MINHHRIPSNYCGKFLKTSPMRWPCPPKYVTQEKFDQNTGSTACQHVEKRGRTLDFSELGSRIADRLHDERPPSEYGAFQTVLWRSRQTSASEKDRLHQKDSLLIGEESAPHRKNSCRTPRRCGKEGTLSHKARLSCCACVAGIRFEQRKASSPHGCGEGID